MDRHDVRHFHTCSGVIWRHRDWLWTFKRAQVTTSGKFCFIAASSSEAGRVYLHMGVPEMEPAFQIDWFTTSTKCYGLWNGILEGFSWGWSTVAEKVAPCWAQMCTVLNTKRTWLRTDTSRLLQQLYVPKCPAQAEFCAISYLHLAHCA
jgi:hypothetical protein